MSNCFDSFRDTYGHVPSLSSIAIGISVGIGRIALSRAILPHIPKSASSSITMIASSVVLHILIHGIVAPLIEENMFRSQLKDSSFVSIAKNSVCFGLWHSLLPGSLQHRVMHIASSIIGGFFYCGAKLAADDVWASVIAHSLYNLSGLV